MDSRATAVLRIVTIVLVVALAGLILLVGQAAWKGFSSNTPRTELERAVAAAEEAVRANPESAPARIKLAAAYLENGASNAAREQATIAIRLAPKDPAGYYILGLIESKTGNNAAAIKQLTKAANTDGQLAGFYLDVWRAASSAYERSGDSSKAIDAMNQALNYGPENSELLYNRGRLYEAEKKWADALYDYVQAANFVPDYKEATTAAERIAKAHPEAVKEVKKRFEIDPLGSMNATETPSK